MAGEIFQDDYDDDLSTEEVASLIKTQLSDTREKLNKDNIGDMQQAISCIKHNKECRK